MKCAYCSAPAAGVIITGATWVDNDQVERATYEPACLKHGKMTAIELAEQDATQESSPQDPPE